MILCPFLRWAELPKLEIHATMIRMEEIPTPNKRKRGRKPVLDPLAVAEQIPKLRGNISAIARMFNVSRSSVLELIHKKPALERMLEDTRESVLDNVETSLIAQAMAGHSWAVCFYLKTQGRKRGYIEREQTLPPLEAILGSLDPATGSEIRRLLTKGLLGGSSANGTPQNDPG